MRSPSSDLIPASSDSQRKVSRNQGRGNDKKRRDNSSDVGAWLKWFGIISGALSFYNLTYRVFQLPTWEVFQQLLAFYRALLHPPAEMLIRALIFLGMFPPQPDVVIMWVLVGACIARCMTKNMSLSPKERVITSIICMLSGPFLLLFMGLIWLIKLDRHFVGKKHPKSRSAHLFFFAVAREIVVVLLVFLIFVGINGAGPSMFP